jgi:hypothetical protein
MRISNYQSLHMALFYIPLSDELELDCRAL